VTPPETLPRDYQAIEEIQGKGFCVPYRKEFIRPDGRRTAVLISGCLLPGSQTTGVAYAVDLSLTAK
jgi:hypothetical protein